MLVVAPPICTFAESLWLLLLVCSRERICWALIEASSSRQWNICISQRLQIDICWSGHSLWVNPKYWHSNPKASWATNFTEQCNCHTQYNLKLEPPHLRETYQNTHGVRLIFHRLIISSLWQTRLYICSFSLPLLLGTPIYLESVASEEH